MCSFYAPRCPKNSQNVQTSAIFSSLQIHHSLQALDIVYDMKMRGLKTSISRNLKKVFTKGRQSNDVNMSQNNSALSRNAFLPKKEREKKEEFASVSDLTIVSQKNPSRMQVPNFSFAARHGFPF